MRPLSVASSASTGSNETIRPSASQSLPSTLTNVESPHTHSPVLLSPANHISSFSRSSPEITRAASPDTSLPQIVLTNDFTDQSRLGRRPRNSDASHTSRIPSHRIPLRARSHNSLPPQPPPPQGPLPPPPPNDNLPSHRLPPSPISDARSRTHNILPTPLHVLPHSSSRPPTASMPNLPTVRLTVNSSPP
ncbi:hypothetical protein LXA43DRAFT_1104342 [Ganoderma leucocontextum]|nr:hypothetical protein LXA43DRAFT_1104342 [Ganoderma leucocontextum]